MRNLILNETTPEAELGGGGEPEEAPVAVEPETPEAEAAPEAPAFDYSAPEFQEAVAGFAARASEQQFGQLLHLIQNEAPTEDPLVLDPFNMEPEEYTKAQTDLFGKMLDERLAPFMEVVQDQRAAKTDEFVSGRIESSPELPKIADLLPAPKEGAEDTRQADAAAFIEIVASSFLPAAEEMHGPGQHAVTAALKAGAEVAQQKAQAIFDAGRASYKAELERIGESVESPQGGEATDRPEPAKDVFAAAERFYERQQRV